MSAAQMPQRMTVKEFTQAKRRSGLSSSCRVQVSIVPTPPFAHQLIVGIPK